MEKSKYIILSEMYCKLGSVGIGTEWDGHTSTKPDIPLNRRIISDGLNEKTIPLNLIHSMYTISGGLNIPQVV